MYIGLMDYLIKQGWSEIISKETSISYTFNRYFYDSKIAAKKAAESIDWAKDEEHDYYDELLSHIKEWQELIKND